MINSILLQETAPAIHESAKALGETYSSGGSMTMIVIGVVIAALIIVYLIYKYVAKSQGKAAEIMPVPEAVKAEKDVSGEVNAAIALALHLYRSQLHDNEDARITMQRVARTYSPWSSKIYGLTRPPR